MRSNRPCPHGKAIGKCLRAVLCLALGVPSLASAQAWIGGSPFGGAWSDPLNWLDGILPVSGTTARISFLSAASPLSNQDLASPFVLNSLVVGSFAPSISLTGGTLRFAGSAMLQQNASDLATFANRVTIDDTLVYDGSGSAVLAGTIDSTGVHPPAATRLVKSGTGTLFLAAENPFAGEVIVEQGRVSLQHQRSLALGHVRVNVDQGLAFNSFASIALGNLSGSGALSLGATQLSVGAAAVTGTYSGRLTATTGSLVVTGPGRLELSGLGSSLHSARVDAGTLAVSGGSLVLNSSSAIVSPALRVANGGVLEVGAGGKLDALGGNLGAVYIDGTPGTRASVDGTGSRLSAGLFIRVGDVASGSLSIRRAGLVSAPFVAIGLQNASVGSLAIDSGGLMTTGSFVAGAGPGASGTATLTGAGSRLVADVVALGSLASLGNADGVGKLTIRNGALVDAGTVSMISVGSTVQLQVGTLRTKSLEGTGMILGLDRGSLLHIDATQGDSTFAGRFAGLLDVRKSGNGTLSLTSVVPVAGTFDVAGGRIVFSDGMASRFARFGINVDNALDWGGAAEVGVGALAGRGSLDLAGRHIQIEGDFGVPPVYSGVLIAERLVKLGRDRTQTFSGLGNRWTELSVQSGSLVLAGASASVSRGDVGNSNPLVPVSELAVEQGGVLRFSESLRIDGLQQTQVKATGAGSLLETETLIVGDTRQGALMLNDAARVRVFGAAVLGNDDKGGGKLTIEGGGSMESRSALVGMAAGAAASVVIDGAGSAWRIGGPMFLGTALDTHPTLTVRNGGHLEAGELELNETGVTLKIDRGTVRVRLFSSEDGKPSMSMVDPAAGAALEIDGNAGFATYRGSISGTGSLVKSGASLQSLVGANTFTGSVSVTGGRLDMATGSASAYHVSGGRLTLGMSALGTASLEATRRGQIVYDNASLTGGLLTGTGLHDVSAVASFAGTRFAREVSLSPRDGALLDGVVNEGSLRIEALRSVGWQAGRNAAGSVIVAGRLQANELRSSGALIVERGADVVSTSDLHLEAGSRTQIGTRELPGGTVALATGAVIKLQGMLANSGTILGGLEVTGGGVAIGEGRFGNVVVGDGGAFGPGNGTGIATSTTAAWLSGGTLLVEFAAADGAPGEQWDLWKVEGTLKLVAGSAVGEHFTIAAISLDGQGMSGPLTGFDHRKPYRWLVLTASGGIVGFDPTGIDVDAGSFRNALGGGAFGLALNGGDLFVEFVPAPVPEPAAWVLIGAGLGMVAWRGALGRRSHRLRCVRTAPDGQTPIRADSPIRASGPRKAASS